jgi:glycosyltransferase involved in cell wall biosynthesis
MRYQSVARKLVPSAPLEQPWAGEAFPMITVIVPTRNRPLQLERCLLAMRDLDTGGDFAWEVIVVDNGSEDGPKSIVEKFKTCLPLRYVFEPKRGLSRARNRGIAEARYPIVAFTDDDCLVDRNWLAAISTVFDRHPDVSIVSGRVELDDPRHHAVATRVFDRTAQVATAEDVLTMTIGCNMACRRAVIDLIGVFDPSFGKGTRIGSAEDIDFLYRALKAGAKIVYSPDVVVRHAHGRDTPASVASVTQDYVTGRGAFYAKFIGDRQILKMAYWEVRALVKERSQRATASKSPYVLRDLAKGALYRILDASVR